LNPNPVDCKNDDAGDKEVLIAGFLVALLLIVRHPEVSLVVCVVMRGGSREFVLTSHFDRWWFRRRIYLLCLLVSSSSVDFWDSSGGEVQYWTCRL
jgi:hypothetical protein